MKILRTHEFPGPIDRTVEIMMGISPDELGLPNLMHFRRLENVERDGVFHIRNEYNAHGAIPAVVQHIISPKMFAWIEEAS